MPDLSTEDAAKLLALEDMIRAGQKIRITEFVSLYFPEPDFQKDFAYTQIDAVRGFEGVSSFADIRARILSSKGSPFLDLPQSVSVGDDNIDINFSDIDGEISRLCYLYGQGIRAEIFNYYPDVDLNLSVFTGHLRAPKDANGITLKVQLSTGFRSAKLLLPRRLPAPGCMLIHGRLLNSQVEIDAHKGCPFNAHLPGGTIGNLAAPPVCARDSVGTCLVQLGTTRYFPGFKTVIDTIANNQTKGPNLPATAKGNDASLTEPIRVIAGERLVKGLRLLASRAETNTRHPEQGFVAALFEIAEGEMNALSDARINGVVVGFQHLNLRYGVGNQPPTGFSPNIGSYGRTAHFFGRIQGNFNNVKAEDLSGSIKAQGSKDVRVYSDVDTYVEQYTTNRAWWLLEMLTNKRWGYGEDHDRYDIQSIIDTAAWCDEFTSVTDPNGNVFAGTRSTFNAELNGRATQTQVEDLCTAGRISLPFEHNGKKMFVPLREETIDSSIPYFTDEGSDANICVDGQGRPLASWSYVGDDELPNQYTVTFDDASNGFTSTPLIFGDQLQQLRAGKAWGDTTIRIINKDVPAFGITNMSEAARLGNSLLYTGVRDSGGIKNNFTVKFTTWFSQCFEVRMNKLVRVRLRALTALFDALGIAGFEYFRVTSRKRKGNLQVELTLQAYAVDYYAAMETTVEIPTQPIVVNPGGGRLDIPCGIAFTALTHTASYIEFGLENC